ncbi:autotransporter outer membrane beta-barrel domain-containing protein, partial [Inquilinus limosus]
GTGNSQSALLFQNNAFTINVGGSGGASGAGKTVMVDLDDAASPLDVTTTGDRAFGLVAQSIGGGGGIGGGVASAGTRAGIQSVSVGGEGGTGNLDGGEVSLSLGGSDITTHGIGSHAVVAQSIGGGGGIGGDATGVPLSLDGPNSTGSIGDAEDVTIVSGGTIATAGGYAFGILAQSIGGGGGFGGDQQGTFAGSNGSTDPDAVSGDVMITANNVIAAGENSVGIFAQSASGRSNGTVTIDVAGKVVGGSGPQGAGVWVAGGKDNLLTVSAGGSISAVSGTAIRFDGDSNGAAGSVLTVDNYGTIFGDILLENADADCAGTTGHFPDCAAGTVNNYSSHTLVDASLYQADVVNQGRMVVGRSGVTDGTEITGHFTQGAAGTLVVDADFNRGDADRLLVRGDAALGGTLDLQAASLRPDRALTVLTVDGTTAGTLMPEASPIYRFALAPDGHDTRLSVASADFDAPSMRLAGNQSKVARGLQGIWDAGGTDGFGRLFATLGTAAEQGRKAYSGMLSELSPGVALAPAAQLQAGLARFNGALMSCPVFSGTDALTNETDCAWAQVTGRSTQQTADTGTSGFSNDSITYQVGGQHEVAPGWFVGMSAAYQDSWLDGYDNRVSGDGSSGYLGLTVKREMGAWQVAGALSGSYGSFDLKRRIAIPGFEGTRSSDPDVFAGSARLRVARTFAFSEMYLKPSIDLDAIYSRMPGYREGGGGDLGLKVEDSDQFTFAFSPTLEVGGRVAAGNATLRPYAYAGVTILSDDDWSAKARFTGAPSGTGSFDTSLPIDDVVARIGAGVQLLTTAGMDIRLQYDGEFSDRTSSNAGSLRAIVPF